MDAATSSQHRTLTAARVRGGLSVLAGIASAGTTAWLNGGRLWSLVGWNVAVLTYLIWLWLETWRTDGTATRRLARTEHERGHTADVVLLSAAVASMSAVAHALVVSASEGGAMRTAVVLSAVATTLLSWMLVNAVYGLKYARLYYREDTGAGLIFPDTNLPNYRDFAYFACTVGMSFAVSDVEASSTPIRTAILCHGLLSYAFNAGTIAVAISLVTSLAH